LTGDLGDAPNSNLIFLNTIAGNDGQGVAIDVGQKNLLRYNAIYNNTLLGIDLGAIGVDTNDDDSVQTADKANRGQNFPVPTSASGTDAAGSVAGMLPTIPGTYLVDLYISSSCGPSSHGQGELWVGSGSVTVPAGQTSKAFTLPIAAPLDYTLFDGNWVTATATDSLGNTSEFSTCVPYHADTIFSDGFD